MSKEKSCRTCGFFAELKESFERSDGAVIYGYCFKDGDKDYSPNMGKGYPVFVDGGGGACKQYKRRRAALREQLTTNCHQLEPVTNRNGLNCWISVEDRLPPEGERVLATDGAFVGEMYINKRGKWQRYNVNDSALLMALDILWWMPLPEPPEV